MGGMTISEILSREWPMKGWESLILTLQPVASRKIFRIGLKNRRCIFYYNKIVHT